MLHIKSFEANLGWRWVVTWYLMWHILETPLLQWLHLYFDLTWARFRWIVCLWCSIWYFVEKYLPQTSHWRLLSLVFWCMSFRWTVWLWRFRWYFWEKYLPHTSHWWLLSLVFWWMTLCRYRSVFLENCLWQISQLNSLIFRCTYLLCRCNCCFEENILSQVSHPKCFEAKPESHKDVFFFLFWSSSCTTHFSFSAKKKKRVRCHY